MEDFDLDAIDEFERLAQIFSRLREVAYRNAYASVKDLEALDIGGAAAVAASAVIARAFAESVNAAIIARAARAKSEQDSDEE